MAKYVNSQEVRKILGCSRQFVQLVADREGWHRKDNNRPYYYDLNDVNSYLLDRNHSDRARAEFHTTFRGMIRHENGFNPHCPICRLEKPDGI